MSVAPPAVLKAQTPEEVLKSRGLTKSGTRYVLDAEAGFLEEFARVQPRYGELKALYQNLKSIADDQDRYNAIDMTFKSVRAELRNVRAAIDDFPPGFSNNIRKQEWADLLEWDSPAHCPAQWPRRRAQPDVEEPRAGLEERANS